MPSGKAEIAHDGWSDVDQSCDAGFDSAGGKAAPIGDQEGMALEIAEAAMAAEAFGLAGLLVADTHSDQPGDAEFVRLGAARQREGDLQAILRALAEMQHFRAVEDFGDIGLGLEEAEDCGDAPLGRLRYVNQPAASLRGDDHLGAVGAVLEAGIDQPGGHSNPLAHRFLAVVGADEEQDVLALVPQRLHRAFNLREGAVGAGNGVEVRR
jgi:hypothetical protein